MNREEVNFLPPLLVRGWTSEARPGGLRRFALRPLNGTVKRAVQRLPLLFKGSCHGRKAAMTGNFLFLFPP